MENYTAILIKNLKLDMLIGVHDHEKIKTQTVIVNLDLRVADNAQWQADKIGHVLNYETIVSAVQDIAERGHINLIETFVEHIAQSCLEQKTVKSVTVRAEKPQAFDCAESVAVEIFRISPLM